MTASFFRLLCCSLLLLASLLPGVSQSWAAIAPDVTSLTSISSALSTPVRLAADSSGGLYVSDPRGGGIVRFASDGSHAATIPVTTGILGVAVASNGDILVSQGTSVAVYSAAGVKKSQFGTFGKANGIAISASGDIFVVDSLNNTIQAFNTNYSPRNGAANSFGSAGSTPGTFRLPTGIAYEKVSDQLAIVDTRNGRIQFFSTAGVFQRSIGSFGAGPLKFTSPQSVSFEYSADQATLKRIYVVDSYQSTIQVIDGATGEFIRYIGAYGVTEGKLITPSDILFDKNSRLIVANGTGKLALFGIADPSTGPFLQIDSVPQATNVAQLTISGTTTGTSVTINGTAATVNGTIWSGNIDLIPGANLITVVATDASGSTTRTATVTASAPAGTNPVLLTVSPVAAQTSQASLTLSGTVTAGATVTVNGVAAQVSGTTWSKPITLLSGSNVLHVLASKTGMDTSSSDLSVTLDASLPVVATRLPSSGSIFSTPLQTISGTVSSPYATTVILTVNGVPQAVPVSDGLFSIPFVLAPGTNSLSVAAVDTFGASTPAVISTVTYDPQAPRVTVSSPAAAVSTTLTYHLTGTTPLGSTVMINGTTTATVTGTSWSANVPLTSGVNSIEVKATPPSGSPTTALTSVTYSPGTPALSITSPAKDSPVATAVNIISGTAAPGATVTARINGVPTAVTTSATGSFSVAVPELTAAGTNTTVIISVIDPVTGATSTSSRTLLYDPTPPVFISATPTPIIVTTSGGLLFAKDKNGPVGTVTYPGGVPTLDLTGVTYDPTTLNIQALSPAGLTSRTGSFSGAVKPTLADALKALRVSAKIDPAPTFAEMLTGDVAPMTSFESQPDGKIGLDDVVIILNKVLGLIP
jgi:hypothetical protein